MKLLSVTPNLPQFAARLPAWAIIWMSAIGVCAALLHGSSVAAAPAAANPGCPSVLLIESTSGKYYLADFQARAATKAAFDLTIYTKSAVYTASIPPVDISKPVPLVSGAFRSVAAIIRNPGDDEFLAATVGPGAGSHFAECGPENVIIPSVASLTSPDRHVAPETDALESELAVETAESKSVLLPVPATNVTVPACDTPFSDASVDNLVKPEFTPEQRNDTTLQSIAVRVSLDAKGTVTNAVVESSSGNPAVDAIALDAAKKSTYHPAYFACQAEISSHVIRIDFSR